MRPFSKIGVPQPTIDEALRRFLETEEVDVEVGAGQGLHAIRYCQSRHDRKLLAIERTHARFKSLHQRRKNHPDLENLFIVHADAISIFTHVLRENSVGKVFFLYPNPYPKAKQANLRWHNMPFMEMLFSRLKHGGELELATNIAAYAQEAETALTALWKCELLAKQRVTVGRTHFEKKYLERGDVCWNLTFRKN